MPPAFQYGSPPGTPGVLDVNSTYSMKPDSAHAPATDAIAITCTEPREIRRPIVRLISAPRNGSSGIHASSGIPANFKVVGSIQCPLVPQGGESIDVDVAPAAEHGHHDREAHGGLRRGDRDHDQREGVRRE